LIPDAARPALEGAIPATICTCSADGVPNASQVSQVWYVDPTHVAVSHQFFSKTMRNLREVPYATLHTNDPRTLDIWQIKVRHTETQREGPVFDQMALQLEAIASMTGTTGLWHLKAAEIFEVESIELIRVREAT
jgi:predicted pyridoxine 5'-phosphate oxidase superfamily flavin-nucleotide-binding protein